MKKQITLDLIINLLISNKLIEKEKEKSITLDSSLNQYIDSLEIIELSIQIEKIQDKSIPNISVENWKTFGDVVETYLNLQDV